MKARLILSALFLLPVLAFMGCEGDQGPPGPAGPSSTSTCAECHNGTNIITGKVIQWEESLHGAGESFIRGTSRSCAGCHSGSAFRTMIEAGLNPGSLTEGDPTPTRQDCRTCHQIHKGEEYDSSGWALQTVAPVEFYADAGTTFDGGDGNLCVNCHQPRRVFPTPVEGIISGISGHWGPHHGPQSSMLMGRAGAGDTQGNVAGHYNLVEDTCLGCHMGDEQNHTFEPAVSRCQTCHPGATSFDIDGRQSTIDALIDELGDLLVEANLIDENSEDGHPIVSSAPEAHAIALWNWIYVAHEDKSHGAHNPNYAQALLEDSIALMQAARVSR